MEKNEPLNRYCNYEAKQIPVIQICFANTILNNLINIWLHSDPLPEVEEDVSSIQPVSLDFS